MSVSIWQTPEAAPPARADIVIIGAGLIGSYLALRLSALEREVLVLEARHVAGGASGRNGGLLLSGIARSYGQACRDYGRTAAYDLWRLTERNRETMIGWATRLGTPVRRCGSYTLACTPEQAEDLRESAALLHEDGVAVEWRASDPLGRGFLAAVGHQADGAIQAALLTAALLRASSASLRETAEVYALESQHDGVLVRARGGDVLAQQVILATNAWTPLLVDEFAGLIAPGRGQVLATAPAPRLIERSCSCDDGFEYFQQLPDGRLVLGGFRRLAFDEERTYADNTTPLIQRALDEFMAQHFPELAGVAVERRWSGTMAFTEDGLPLVGRLRRDERIAFAVAFNGHGLGLGVVAAEDLANAIEHGGQVESMFAARRTMSAAV
jgi:glycine/D-amino acid oxidase-like deaminating enzyme